MSDVTAADLVKPPEAPAVVRAPTSYRTRVMTPSNGAEAVRKYGGVAPTPISHVDQGLVLGIYAPGGTGKTTVAGSITDSELGRPALLLNAQGNPFVLSSYSDRIDVIDLENFEHQNRIRADILRDPDCKYKTIIIDNWSELYYRLLAERYGNSEVTWQMHSKSTSMFLSATRQWVAMATSSLKLNIVCVYQETPEARVIRGKEILSRSELGLNKALQFQVPTIVNFMGRLYVYEDVVPYRRVLDFRPMEELHQAKLQVDPHDEFAKAIPMEQLNPSLASILDTVRGHKPWPVEKHALPTRKRTKGDE